MAKWTREAWEALTPAERREILAKQEAKKAAVAPKADTKEARRQEIADAVAAEQAFRADLYKNFTPQGTDEKMTAEEAMTFAEGKRKLSEMERHSLSLINAFKLSYPDDRANR